MISIILPNFAAGGAERVAIYIANEFYLKEIKVEFVLLNAIGDLLPLVEAGIPVYDLQAQRIRDSIFPLSCYFRNSQPDAILVGLWPLTSAAILAWQLAGRTGRIFVQDHNNLSITCTKELGLSLSYLKLLLRCTYPLATGVMAVSEGVKRDLSTYGAFNDSRVKVIYNPVVRASAELFSSNPDERSQRWGSGCHFNILSVGTFKAQKNFPLLLQAFAMLPNSLNVKLTILGEGVLRPKLEALIKNLGISSKVSLPGFVLDPSPWFRTADLFVLSSSWEGLPTVMIEALQFGVPVVSTDCLSGPNEILDNGRYGRLVPVGDATALATAMQASLLESHDHDALRRRAQDFSVPRIADQYLAYFRSMGAQL